jgi:hypothetical protein
MTFLNRWKFTVLLATLLLLMVVHPLIKEGVPFVPVLYDIFLVAVFLGMIFVLFQHRKSRVTALVLGIPTIAGLVTNYLLPGASPIVKNLLFHLVPVVFLGYTITTILRTIYAQRKVSLDGINGALSGYLLLGFAFGQLYWLTEVLLPGSFHLDQHVGAMPVEADRRHNLLMYFSLITLTSVGYGDIAPHSPPARTLAWLEAVAGQFYIAVVVAALVGLKVSATMGDQRPRPPEASGSE